MGFAQTAIGIPDVYAPHIVIGALSAIRAGRGILLKSATSEALVLGLTVAALGVAQAHYTASGLGEYVLVRRVATAVQLVLLAGLGVGVPRFVASDPSRARLYILAGSGVLLLNGVLFLLFALVSPALVGAWFLGGLSSLALPLGLVTLSQLMHGSAYAAYRGLMKFGTANVLQVLNVGAVPVACLLIFGEIRVALIVWGLVALALALAANAAILLRSDDRPKVEHLKDALPTLLAFGIPRVVTDAGVGFVNAFPVVLIARADVSIAGTFGAAQSVITAGAALLGVSGVAWLPRAALMLSKNQTHELGRRVHVAGRAALRATAFAAAALVVAPLTLYEVWLGPNAGGMAHVALLASIWSLPGMVLYSILRSPLDALSVRPWSGVAISVGALTSVLIAFAVAALAIPTQLIGPLVFGGAWCAAGAMSLYLTARLLPGASQLQTVTPWLLPGTLVLGAAVLVNTPAPLAAATAGVLLIPSVVSWLKTLPEL